MLRRACGLVLVSAIFSSASGIAQPGPTLPPIYVKAAVANEAALPTCNAAADGHVRVAISEGTVNYCNGTAWSNVGDGGGGGGGSAIILDLGDDASNESTDLTEIATVNDPDGIVTEPAADKALFDFGPVLLETELDSLAELNAQVGATLEEEAHASEHDGTGISVSGEALSVATGELNDLTWGDNSDASVLWTFDPTGATNPVITITDGVLNVSTGALQVGGVVVATGAHFSPNADPGVDHSGYVAGHGDGANCLAGEINLGVDGSGAAQGCYEPTEADITDLQHRTAGIGLVDAGDALDTASQEAGFLEDGGTTPLTCGGSNFGRVQVMDDGDLEWCDGAATPVLQSVDAKIATHAAVAAAHHTKTVDASELTAGTIPAGRVGSNHIDNLGEIAAGIKRGPDATDTHLLTTDESAPVAKRCLEMDTDGSITLASDTCANLGPGGSTSWDTIADPGGNGAINMANTAQTLDWDTPVTATGVDWFTFNFDHDATVDVMTQRGVVMQRVDSGNDAADDLETLLQINNLDTNDPVDAAVEVTSAAGGINVAFDVEDDQVADVFRLDGGKLISEEELGTLDAGGPTLGAETVGNFVADVADGTGIDGAATGEGSTYTPTLDLTEINDHTVGDNSDATLQQTFDPTGASNPRWDYTDGNVNLAVGNLQEGGTDVSVGAHTIDTTRSDEEIEDVAGAMVTGNTETRITVTYQDADGTIDFVVDDMNDDVPEAGDFGNATDLDANGLLVGTAGSTVLTAAADDNDTTPASTAFVQQEINGAGGTGLTCASGQCNVDLGTTIDISDETNLAVTSPVTLTGDTVGLNQNAGTDVTGDLEEEAHCSEHDSSEVDCVGEQIVIADHTFSIPISPGMFRFNGECSPPESIEIGASGFGEDWAINCPLGGTNLDGFLYAQVHMPGGWDGGAITLTITARTADDPAATETLQGVVNAQCYGDDDVPSGSWTANTGLDVTFTSGSAQYDTEIVTSSSLTPDGSCAAGDWLKIRYVVCDTGTPPTTGCSASTHDVANTYITGAKIEATRSALSD